MLSKAAHLITQLRQFNNTRATQCNSTELIWPPSPFRSVPSGHCSRPQTFLFVSDWHPSIFFLVYRALPNLQIIPSAKPSITANHKSYSKPKWNSNCSFFEATLLELIIQNIYMLKSPDSSHANLSWLDVIGTGLNFQWFFWESETVSVKLNFLINQSWANCYVGCWKVLSLGLSGRLCRVL